MREPHAAACADFVARSPSECYEMSLPSISESSHSLLLLQLRTELEGKWRPDKFGILRRWMNVYPKHWKEDAYDDAMRSGTAIRNVKKSNGQKRARKKHKDRNPIRLKTTLMERFVQQVSPAEEDERFADCRGDPGIPSEANQRRARRFMLEEEVMGLQKRLQREVDLHLALENAVTPSCVARPRYPQDIPLRTRQLLEDIEAVEKVVAQLEDQSTALLRELGHERKERESIERRGRAPGRCTCGRTSSAGGAPESSSLPKHSRQIARSRRTKVCSDGVRQHSEQSLSLQQLSLQDHSHSKSAARAAPPSCEHCRALKSGNAVEGRTVKLPSKSYSDETDGRASLTWTSKTPDSDYSVDTSGSTPASDSSSQNSFFSACNPHNRRPPPADARVISQPRCLHSGAFTRDQSGSCGPPPGDREQENGATSPAASDYFPTPSSPSTPEHRGRPSSPAGATAGLLRFRCDGALPTEEMYSLKQLSRRFVGHHEEQRSSSAWGACGSEEYYSPIASSGLVDSLSGSSQPSPAEKRSKVRVKLSLQADDNPVASGKLDKRYGTEDAVTRQSLMFELMSPGLEFDMLPVSTTARVHDKYQFRDYSQTPNLLSEEMIRCMVSIYWHLADPAVIIRNRSSYDNVPSPTSHFGHTTSSFSSFSESSLLSGNRSPLIDLRSMDDVLGGEGSPDPYRVVGKLPWAEIGMYCRALEVSWMSVSADQLGYAAQALFKFRLLVEQLPNVDPRIMSHSQKLAFWINLYNSLMMHAYLAYGIPRNDLKYFALLQKATYNVGGCSFNAAAIEYCLLRGRPPSYRPQIGLLLALHKSKWMLTEEQSKFAIDYPEPQVVFSLCCGARSSPAVRLYTAGNVHKQINFALRDYTRATVGLNSKGKCLVPKLLYTYAHDYVDDARLLDWICGFLPASQAGLVQECYQHRQSRLLGAAKFAVLPFELSFRYLFAPIFDPSSDFH